MKKKIFNIFKGLAATVVLLMVTTSESRVAANTADTLGVRAIRDVVGQGRDGPVVAEGGAALWRTRNGLSFKFSMPTPRPGAYDLPIDGEGYSPESVDPEVFTLWAFVYNDPGSDSWDGAFAVEVYAAGGRNLTLNGYLTRDTEPFSGEKLDNPGRAEVHLALVPHGPLSPDLIPDALESLPGISRDFWWFAVFK